MPAAITPTAPSRRESDNDQLRFSAGPARLEALGTAFEIVIQRDLQAIPFAREKHPTRSFICRFNRSEMKRLRLSLCIHLERESHFTLLGRLQNEFVTVKGPGAVQEGSIAALLAI